MERNKKNVSKEMASQNTCKQYSFLFGYHENITLYSFVVTKEEKCSVSVINAHWQYNFWMERKPEIAEYHNQTKSGVDTIDEMEVYHTKRNYNM